MKSIAVIASMRGEQTRWGCEADKRIAGTFTRHPLTTSGKRQSLLKTNDEAAVALFLAIRASRTQRQALSSVARLLLKDQELDAFEAKHCSWPTAVLRGKEVTWRTASLATRRKSPTAFYGATFKITRIFLINVYLSEYRAAPLADPHSGDPTDGQMDLGLVYVNRARWNY
jgi:hypothetical protein